jgi:hypothetical protein
MVTEKSLKVEIICEECLKKTYSISKEPVKLIVHTTQGATK